jgi:membrane protease YdiL (CAAX protease family)
MTPPHEINPLLVAIGLAVLAAVGFGFALTLVALAVPRVRDLLWPAGPRSFPPRPLPAAVCVGLALLATFGLSYAAAALVGRIGLWAATAISLSGEGASLLAVAVLARVGPGRGLAATGLGPPRLRHLFSGAAGYACTFWMLVASGLLVLLAYRLDGRKMPAQPAMEFMLHAPLGLKLTVAAVAVLVAPVAEELLFRGVFFGSLRSVIGYWPAALGSSLLFAAVHQAPAQLLPIAVLGLALCWLYNRTGSLWPGIVVHATQNALSTAMVLLGYSRLF